MRAFRFYLFAAAVGMTGAFFAVGNGPKTLPEPKAPSQSDSKKDDTKTDAKKNDEPKPDPLDEELLRKADLATDGDALVNFLKKRVLPENERPEITRLIGSLSHSDYRTRDAAMRKLTERGVAAIELLRSAPPGAFDVEQARRMERSIRTIHEIDVGPQVVGAAVRVASVRSTKGLVQALIEYVPFADNELLVDELRVALMKHAQKDGKADPLLIAALADRSPMRRAVAAEVLARAAYDGNKDAVKKALTDPDPLVRFAAAKAVALARDRDAIPVIIAAIPELPLNAAWQAEDFLLRLAGKDAPLEPMGKSDEVRTRCRDAWQAWWKIKGDKIDLTKLEDTPRMLGRTLVVLLDENTVAELGPDNQTRWAIPGLNFPLDAQLIGADRVLIAEHHGSRITERTLRGEILWQRQLVGPLAAQRMSNGSTFVATDHQLLEYDKTGAITMNISFPDEGRKIMKAAKLESGEIVCMLADARIVRFDTRGTELSSFNIPLGMRLFGGRIHMLPTGRVLVPYNSENKVIEYDVRGKAVWEVSVPAPIAATRLPNGNTLITSMDPTVGAVEMDRVGVPVWSYQHPSNTRVTRAIRR